MKTTKQKHKTTENKTQRTKQDKKKQNIQNRYIVKIS